MTPMPDEHLEEAPHVLVVHIDRDGYLAVKVECPHTTIDRPCGTWEEHAKGDACRCTCGACLAGEHDKCDSEYVAEVGRKHCQCDPVDQCWFDHAVGEVGTEMLRMPKAGVTFRLPARMTGHGWDEPIDVEPLPS
jgi:hypothetical protein